MPEITKWTRLEILDHQRRMVLRRIRGPVPLRLLQGPLMPDDMAKLDALLLSVEAIIAEDVDYFTSALELYEEGLGPLLGTSVLQLHARLARHADLLARVRGRHSREQPA